MSAFLTSPVPLYEQGPRRPLFSDATCCVCHKKYSGDMVNYCDSCNEKERQKESERAELSKKNRAEQMEKNDEPLTKPCPKTFPRRAADDATRMSGPALKKAEEILPMISKPRLGVILLVLGDRGTGKTVMATWLARQLGCGLYIKAADLFESLRATYAVNAKESEKVILDRYRKASFLVIDEIQERKESEWEQSILNNIIDHRYDNFLPTLIIANLKPTAIDACLGASIISRCKRTGGGIIECNWPPYPH
jgi:DNA replication protein DnaC